MEARKPTRTVPALGKLALKKVAVQSRAPSAPGRPTTAPLGPVRRAVVAEADKAVREAVAAILPKDRFEVHAFADGDSAYEHISLHGADVVVLGKEMPGIQGTVLSDLLRKGKNGPSLAIVLMSPRYNGQGVGPGDCAAFGADQFIPLPSGPDLLLERIDAAIAQRVDVAASVDEHECSSAPQPSQAHERTRERRVLCIGRAARRHEGRNLVQNPNHIGLCGDLKSLGGNRGHRARRFEISSRDPRACHNHLLDALGLRRLCECRGRADRERETGGRKQD